MSSREIVALEVLKLENMQEIIRNLRESAGISQKEIAKKLFVSRTTYQKFERGEYDPPLSFIIALSDLFQIDPKWLISNRQQQHDIEKLLLSPLVFRDEELTVTDKMKIFLFIRLLKEDEEKEKEYFLSLFY
ncbi:helix-turn-helix domain-containing protein [Pilibacter termitis]|uniref:helix-turn-helix domain-containing protein n=1 Tax=Pilibacter termitis TaxID=263852 RepID=UPI00190E691E|nr:helix-turn-helix transcriptional regulator [Pilibacter termitis]